MQLWGERILPSGALAWLMRICDYVSHAVVGELTAFPHWGVSMKSVLFAATAALVIACAAGAQADVVLNTELGPVAPPGVTTTDASGTRSTKAGAGNVSEAFSFNEWQQRNLRGGAEVGITTDYARSGNGSISFYGVDGNSKADMEIYFSTPFLLSDFQGASYDWYRDSSSTNPAGQHPSLRLATNLGTYLIFESAENGIPTATTDAWVTSTIGSSTNLWANNTGGIVVPGAQNCTPGGQCASLSAWQAANPAALVVGFSTGIGSGWNGGFAGAVDNISFTVNDQTKSFNFEVAVVPEPGTWALMISGFGLAGAMLRRRQSAAAA